MAAFPVTSAVSTYGGNDLWPYWTATSTTASTSIPSAWGSWQLTNATTRLTTANSVYDRWTRLADIGASVRRSEAAFTRRFAKPSDEEVRVELARIRAVQERNVARAVAEKAAREKAALLLEGSLTPEQIEHLRARDCFYLTTLGKDGSARRYRIDRGTHGNVKQVDDKGSILESLCVQPGGVPVEDAMLAQKLWLETDEEAFRKVANITRHR